MSYDTWPINTQNPVELNRYVYAAGNPVRYTDPSGYTIAEYGQKIAKNAVKVIRSIEYSGNVLAPAITNVGAGFFQGAINGAWQGALGYFVGILGCAGYSALTSGNWRSTLEENFDLIELRDSILFGAALGGVNGAINRVFSLFPAEPSMAGNLIFTALEGYWLVGAGIFFDSLWWEWKEYDDDITYSESQKDWPIVAFVQLASGIGLQRAMGREWFAPAATVAFNTATNISSCQAR